MAKNVLAFDFGASSGRAMLGSCENGKINLKEIHRFENNPVEINGTLYWDVLNLLYNIKQGITKAKTAGGFDSIGIDTWGVDFGMIDKNGDLLQNPVHYRDERTTGRPEEVFEIVPKSRIYAETGIQIMRINTLYQLYTIMKTHPELMKRTDKILLMPDLFSYFLTGEKHAEYTNATTMQMVNPNTGTWCTGILKELSIPEKILPSIIDPGEIYGMLSDRICEELSVPKVPVIAVGSHDTSSAVAAVPTLEKDFIYISCGTWALFGTESQNPIINEKTEKYNLTNEGGVGRTTTLLKNIMGLWLIQEARRQWRREGFDVSYHDLEQAALSVEPFKCFIDPDAPGFDLPGNLPRRVREYCEKTGQYVPKSRGEIMRCIYESLAFKNRRSFEMIKDVTGKSYNAIHVLGGGVKDGLLCQITANACAVPVNAGPIEATVMGNIAMQLIALGEFKDLSEARTAVKKSTELLHYTPTDCSSWDEAYGRFLQCQET